MRCQKDLIIMYRYVKGVASLGDEESRREIDIDGEKESFKVQSIVKELHM
jgi:hypothetical protein